MYFYRGSSSQLFNNNSFIFDVWWSIINYEGNFLESTFLVSSFYTYFNCLFTLKIFSCIDKVSFSSVLQFFCLCLCKWIKLFFTFEYASAVVKKNQLYFRNGLIEKRYFVCVVEKLLVFLFFSSIYVWRWSVWLFIFHSHIFNYIVVHRMSVKLIKNLLLSLLQYVTENEKDWKVYSTVLLNIHFTIVSSFMYT